jgi:hypothetical protein
MASASSAAPIINGSFEDCTTTVQCSSPSYVGTVHGYNLNNLATSANGWDVYSSIPGWTTVSGPGIEVQRSGVVTTAQDGNRYVELDSHPLPNSNSSMKQTVALTAGDYVLSFYYMPRTSSTSDNGIKWSFGTSSGVVDGTSPAAWKLYTVPLLGLSAGSYDLVFAADGTQNTLGGFIDNVQLQERAGSTVVPEPATLLLSGLGLLGLAGRARRRTR